MGSASLPIPSFLPAQHHTAPQPPPHPFLTLPHTAGPAGYMAPRARSPAGEKAEESSSSLNDIDRLNAQVHKRVFELKGEGVEPEAVKAVKAGAQVYHRRVRALVYGVAGMCLFFLYQSPSVAFTLAAIATMWFVVDIYGAVLHVVLDTPEFINAPIISTLIGACRGWGRGAAQARARGRAESPTSSSAPRDSEVARSTDPRAPLPPFPSRRARVPRVPVAPQ
jgi:hypothetical protein